MKRTLLAALFSFTAFAQQPVRQGQINQVSGNGSALVTTTGAQTANDCVKIDSGGNHVAAGSGCSSGGGASAYPTVTDASPIAWNLASATVANGIVTLAHGTATRALNLTNLVNGGFYTLVIKQDSTGGAAMTLGTGCTWKVGGGGAGAITLTSTASAIDILAFTYDGTNCYANFQTNFN